MDVTAGQAGCEVAVVVPLHRQPALFVEAVSSVLRQEGPPGFRIVAVLDGCPYRQSLEAATALARAFAPRLALLAQANAGLSAARNAGVRFALAAWPDCRAVFFLDSDNRMGPHLLRRMWSALAAAPLSVGWAYGDFDLFGIPGAWSTAGPHSALQHLSENVCDAAALVRREVFEAGVWFAEELRGGFEDWDFFLSAIGAGFRGLHVPEAGLAYRRRPESMLREARREGAALAAELRRRHPRLFSPRAILALEAEEAPRLLLAGPEGGAFCLDPDAPGQELPRSAALARLAAGLVAPGAAHAPGLVAFAAPETFSALRAAGLLRGLLAHAERLLAAAPCCAVALSRGRSLGLLPWPAAEAERAKLLVLRPDALAGPLAALPRRGLSVELPAAPEAAAALPIAEAWSAALPAALAAAPPRPWRPDGRGARRDAAARAARGLGAWPLLPLAPAAERRDVAFLLPRFGLGGVERAVCCLARALRAEGWRPHVLTSGSERADPPPPGVFDSVLLLPGFDAERHGGGSAAHAGAATALLPEQGEEAEALLGLLAPMQAVLSTHAFAGHALAGRLRRLGVVTAVGLHVMERGPHGEPAGNPQIALAYEHGYDLFVCHSVRLARWCAAAGVPEGKILALANAPGYEADPARVAAALAARRRRPPGPLRALVLGRLDRQKAPDRLPALIAATAGRVVWRIVGRAELDAAPPLPVPVEPPAGDAETLDALYGWADVLVLVSRFEGVPLTVLEAQRMGCVPVALAVGALDEAIADGEDGLLVPQAEGMAAALLRLAADPALLGRLAEGAARRAAGRDWRAEAARLSAALRRGAAA
jgi:glycosyltransferase involved in cell wall biosynthesis